MEKIPYDPADDAIPAMMRSDPNFVTMPVQHTPSPLGIPTHAHLAAGNGGEYRKSYHGFASPVAYVIDSPTSVHVLPMQIDTWNRDEMNATGSRFVPGPLPKHSLSPRGLDALYSGLLECPLTDKVVKTIAGGSGYNDTVSANLFQCPSNNSHPLTDQHISGYQKVTWPWPVHAFQAVTPSPPDTEELNLFWNEKVGDHWLTFGPKEARNATAAGYQLVRKIGLAPTAQSKAPKAPVYLHYSAARHDHFTSASPQPPANYVTFGLQGYLLNKAQPHSVKLAWYWSPESGTSDPQSSGDNVLAQDDGPAASQRTTCEHSIGAAEDCFAAAKSMQGVASTTTVETSSGASDTLAPGCTVTYGSDGVIKAFFNTKQTNKCCGEGVTELSGENAESLVGLKLSVTDAEATITLTGPSSVWYGVGVFAQTMEEAPYTFIVDGTGAVSERRMANHAAGRLLPPTVKVVSNTVLAGKRTVVLSRSATSSSADYANFTKTDMTIPFISAVGSTSSLSYHKNKTASMLAMWPSAGEPVCLCAQPAAPYGHATGTIKYLPTGEEFGFVNYCMPEPRESVLAQRNPTCDVVSAQTCPAQLSFPNSSRPSWPDSPAAMRRRVCCVCVYCSELTSAVCKYASTCGRFWIRIRRTTHACRSGKICPSHTTRSTASIIRSTCRTTTLCRFPVRAGASLLQAGTQSTTCLSARLAHLSKSARGRSGAY